MSYIYLFDVIDMRTLKIYEGRNKLYRNHVYIKETHKLWMLDEENELYLWILDGRSEIKVIKTYSEERLDDDYIYKQVNPYPIAKLGKDCDMVKEIECINSKTIVLVLDRSLYIIKEKKEFEIELKKIEEIKGLTGTIIRGVMHKDIFVIIGSDCKMHCLLPEDLLSDERNSINPTRVITVKGYKDNFMQNCLLLLSQEFLLAMPKTKQSFYFWNLNSRDDILNLDSLQKPWKKLAKHQKNQVYINKYIDEYNVELYYENLDVTDEGETRTASLIYTSTSIKCPLYIMGTNKGRVYIFNPFMDDPNSFPPTLKIEISIESPINHLYIKQHNLLISSMNGLIGIAELGDQDLLEMYKEVALAREGSIMERHEKNMCQYGMVNCCKKLITEGIAGFLEIFVLPQLSVEKASEYVLDGSTNKFTEENIGVIGYDHSVHIFFLPECRITHSYKGHNHKIAALYISEKLNRLIVVGKNCKSYVYNLASKVLERKCEPISTYNILALEKRIAHFLPKKLLKYADYISAHVNRSKVLKKGCKKILDFCHHLNGITTDWKNPKNNKNLFFKSECEKIIKKGNNEELIKLFNELVYYNSNLRTGETSDEEIGFISLQMKIGTRNKKLEHKLKDNKLFKGKFNEVNKYSVLIINFADLLRHLQKNYKAENKGSIFSMFKNTQRREEDKANSQPSPKKFGDLLNFGEAQSNRSNSLWPFPLLSLVHAFGIDPSIDKDLGKEFSICPSLLQFWVGILGAEDSFSFAVPDILNSDWSNSKNYYHWKVSPSLNTLHCVNMFSSLVSVFQFDENFIGSLIGRLIKAISGLLLMKRDMPLISLMDLAEFFNSPNPDVWSASRDIVLFPFIKCFPPETFKELAQEIKHHIKVLCRKIKEGKDYDKLLKEKTELVKFELPPLINNHFGPVELRAVTLLCSLYKEYRERIIDDEIIKKTIKIICIVIMYFLLSDIVK